MAIKYKWIAKNLEEEIQKGKFSDSGKLPTEEELCQHFSVSRQTIRQALTLLETEGVIRRKQGSGSFLTGLSSHKEDNEIAILITTDSQYLYPNLLADIKEGLGQHGFGCKVYVTDNRIDRERSLLMELNDHLPAGILVEGCKSALPNPNLDLYRHLMQKRVPVLFLHNYYPALNGVTYIKDNNYQGATALVNHLYERGHREIGCFFPSDDLQGLERFQGFVDAMRLNHLSVRDDHIDWFHRSDLLCLEQKQETGFIGHFVDQTLLHSKEPCSAVVCYNDEVAFYLIRELKRRQIAVPETIAVVSFDNSYLALADQMSITSMSHLSHEMGSKAAEMMIDMKKGIKVLSKDIPWTIRTRESS